MVTSAQGAAADREGVTVRISSDHRGIGLSGIAGIALFGVAVSGGLVLCERGHGDVDAPAGVGAFRHAEPGPPRAVAAAPSWVVLAPETLVARVDGEPIRGSDLLPFGSDDTPRQVAADNLAFLLDRAIVAATVDRAARDADVELDEAGQERLARLATKLLATEVPDGERALRLRDVRASLLRQALLERRADRSGVALDRELRARCHVEVLLGSPAEPR